MMWARVDSQRHHHAAMPDDTQSSTSSTSQNGRFSVGIFRDGTGLVSCLDPDARFASQFASSEEPLQHVTKDQLEYYLKVHVHRPARAMCFCSRLLVGLWQRHLDDSNQCEV